MGLIYYACKDIQNMGDMLGPYLYKTITGKNAEWTQDFKKKHLMVAGSILQHANDKTTVLGCGFGDNTQKPDGKPKILIIRGKLTEQRLIELGFNKSWVMGDPGLFLPFVYKPTVEKEYKMGIVPHYADFNLVKGTEYHIIDICQPVEKVAGEINKCERVMSSSLHGLIVAHAYNIPATWVEFSDNVVGGGFKFRDYFSSVGIEPYKPLDCRKGIPDNISFPTVDFDINQFRKAFSVLKDNMKP